MGDLTERCGSAWPGRESGDGPIDPGAFAMLAARTGQALAEWHDRHGEHGRLSPEAVLVGRDDGPRVVIRAPGDPPSPAYLAPEQVAMPGRGIDERTDLYALGVMFRGLLAERAPAPLGQIVARLLAVLPEDRYRTARGATADLDRCRSELDRTGHVLPFALGGKDHDGRLMVSRRLYGREHRLARLAPVLDRVAAGGGAHLVCLSGDAGVGKSAFAAALADRITGAGGRALTGRFPGHPWAAPYAAVAQALARPFDLLRGEPDGEPTDWQRRIGTALGAGTGALVDLLPGARPLLGQRTATTDLSPEETGIRLRRAVRRLLAEWAGPDSPLVLVLDNLHWADHASIRLLDEVVSDPDLRHLLVIGTYRPKDVARGHPLHAVLKDLGQRRLGSVVPLRPLPDAAVAELLADTLHTETFRTLPLARVLAGKTASNPLAVGQYLHVLQDDGTLRFERSTGGWIWEMDRVRAGPVLDSALSAVSARIHRLEQPCRRLLGVAALIGDEFDPPTLAAAVDEPAEGLVRHLRAAVRDHLLVHVDDALAQHPTTGFRWLHDQIRQAALSLSPANESAARHRSIEEALRVAPAPRCHGPRVYDLARHLNAGAPPRAGRVDDRLRLAERNLAAGVEANRVGAAEAARRYFAEALRRLPNRVWTIRHRLALALYAETARAEYHAGNMLEAGRMLDTALANAALDLDRAELLLVRVHVLRALGDRAAMSAAALEGLARAGFTLPAVPAALSAAADGACRTVQRRLALTPVDDIVAATPATDPRTVVVSRLIGALLAWGQPAGDRSTLLAAMGVRLALDAGPAAASCMAFAYFGGRALAGRLRDDEGARRSTHLALGLLDAVPSPRFEATVRAFVATSLPYWEGAPGTTLDLLDRAHRAGLEHGDVVGAAASRILYHQHLFVAGAPLARVTEEIAAVGDLLDRHHVDTDRVNPAVNRTVNRAVNRAMEELTGLLRGTAPASGPADEPAGGRGTGWATEPEPAALTCRAMAMYLLGEHAEALRLCRESEKLTFGGPVDFLTAERHFYHALALVATHDDAGPERQAIAAQLTTLQMALDVCGTRSPATFGHKALLISAERARLAGDAAQAMGRFDRAIGQAREFGLVHLEGLAAERAGRYARDRGDHAEASGYLRRARYCYLNWGARARVAQIDRVLAAKQVPPEPALLLDQLDLLTVIKAFHAISGELDLEKVLATLLELLVQHAGAERGCLVLPGGPARNEGLDLAAAAEVDGDRITVTAAPVGDLEEQLPAAVVQYTQRTRELVNGSTDDLRTFAGDPYLTRHRPRSLLCAPVSRNRQLVALLYLEHRQLTDAFTPAHLSTLELLCAQAAIVLENATLHGRLAAANRIFDATCDELPVGLIVLHPDLTVRRASLRAQRLCGLAMPPGTPLREIYLVLTGADTGVGPAAGPAAGPTAGPVAGPTAGGEPAPDDFWGMVTAATTEPGARSHCRLRVIAHDGSTPERLHVWLKPLRDDDHRLVGLTMTLSE